MSEPTLYEQAWLRGPDDLLVDFERVTSSEEAPDRSVGVSTNLLSRLRERSPRTRLASVAAHGPQVERAAHLPGRRASPILVAVGSMNLSETVGNELFDRAADEVGPIDAEQLDETRIGEEDHALFVGQQHPVR